MSNVIYCHGLRYPSFRKRRYDKVAKRMGYVYGRTLYRTENKEYYLYERGTRGVRYDLVSPLFPSKKSALEARKTIGTIKWKLISKLR